MFRKISFVFLFILFCAASSDCQTWVQSPRLDSLRLLCFEKLGIKSIGSQLITTAKVDEAIQNAVTQVCIDFPAIEKLDTVTIGKQLEGGTLATDFVRARAVFKMVGDTARIPLYPIGLDSLRLIAGTIEANNQIKGDEMSVSYYYTFGNLLMFHPKVAVDTGSSISFLVFYYAMDSTLAAASSVTQILPEYIVPLIHYACKEISEMRGNYVAAQYFKSEYESTLRARKPRELELKK